MTKFEKITKTEKDLANVLEDFVDCDVCPVEEDCRSDIRCYDLLLKWLRQEVGE